jgi:hypothetical protein
MIGVKENWANGGNMKTGKKTGKYPKGSKD